MLQNDEHRLFLVTGANRGIGFHIVKKLVEHASLKTDHILFGCRNLEHGVNALRQLNSPPNVRLLQLDTSSKQSIIEATKKIKQDYGSRLDVLINNAGICTRDITVDVARNVFNTNYYGVKMLNECILSLMRENGRIINVSSRVGSIILQESAKNLQDKYTASTLTQDQLDQLVEDFLLSIENNTIEELGYNIKSEFLVYGVSKAALNSLTQVQARQWSNLKNLLFVSVTPGLCATDMTHGMANTRSPELGADSILYTANAARNELVNGGFYRDGKQLPLVNQ